MKKNTQAFLAIWHNLTDEGKADWEKWHTYEHMDERISIPGFLGGRRYMNNNDSEQCCFTIYESHNLSVFQSPPYLERLNNPTSWTKKSATTFRNFTRGACECVSSIGPKNGYGGAIMTIRLSKGKNFSKNTKYFDRITYKANELNGSIRSIIGLCNEETTSVKTTEQKLRKGTSEALFEGVLIIEGYDEKILRENSTTIQNIIDSSPLDIKTQKVQFYSLAYMLTKE